MNVSKWTSIASLAAICAFVLLAIACGPVGRIGGGPDDSSGDSPDSGRKVVDAAIDGSEILVRESFPPGYTAHITSGLPSGCAQFHEAKIVDRTGNTITISVTNTMPADENTACTMVYGTHESYVDLGTDFVSGETYTVKVNDKQATFVAQ